MTVAVAGVNCRELFILLTAFFSQGTAFAEDPFAFLDGAPKIRPPLDLIDTDDTDEEQQGSRDTSSKVSVVASTSITGTPAVPPSQRKEPKTKSKPKVKYQDKIADIAATKGFLPVDAQTLHNTGIPVPCHVKWSGASGKGRSLYVCSYSDECSSPSYVGDLPSAASHVWKHHLGHSIICPYCGAGFYNASGWQDHMGAKHAHLPWYSAQLNPLAPVHPAFPPDGATSKAPTPAPPPPPLSWNLQRIQLFLILRAKTRRKPTLILPLEYPSQVLIDFLLRSWEGSCASLPPICGNEIILLGVFGWAAKSVMTLKLNFLQRN